MSSRTDHSAFLNLKYTDWVYHHCDFNFVVIEPPGSVIVSHYLASPLPTHKWQM